MLGWVLFRADDFAEARAFYAAMLGATTPDTVRAALHLNALVVTALAAGIAGSVPLASWLAAWRARLVAPSASAGARGLGGVLAFGEVAAVAAIFLLAAAGLAASTYNPFIYYRF
jgi:alginate O-acetyltransferase complex protein AlgI